MDMSGDCVRGSGLELGDMEDGVYRAHGVREFEGERVSPGACDDGIRPEKRLRKFLGRAGGTDVLSADVGLVADLEVGRWEAMLVCLGLVP